MNQRGYLKFIILLIALPLLGLLFLKPKVTPSSPSTGYCLNTPSPQTAISYDIQKSTQDYPNDTDVRLKKRILNNELPYIKINGGYNKLFSQPIDVPRAVFKYHFAKAGRVKDYDNQSRLVYINMTHCDGNIGGDPTDGGTIDAEYDSKCTPDDRKIRSSVSFWTKPNIFDSSAFPDNRAFNLLMLDVSDDPQKNPNPQAEVIRLEYYLKNSPIHGEIDNISKYPDGSIPKFIQEYCQNLDQNTYINELLIIPGSNHSIPEEIVVDKNNPKITFYSNWTRIDANGNFSDFSLPKDTGTYKLIGFTPVNSPLGQANLFNYLTPNMTEADLRIPVNNLDYVLMLLGGIYKDGDQEYYFGQVSAARFYVLINRSNPQYAFYYTKKLAQATPTPVPSSGQLNQYSLQLDTLKPVKLPSLGWMVPECKPAIYLYPQSPTQVSVQVNPQGYLTYTNPKYPEGGWQVTAYPSGKIDSGGQSYDYLYYESKIKDEVVDIPSQGYVESYNSLPSLYDRILPQLGLNPKETQDFKDYWNGILPKATYYFVGVMSETSIDKIEPLTIAPQPQTNIRVRLYFQPLDQKIDVAAPAITTPTRSGFTVVEWGGLVKTDPSHPFTCSQ